MSVSWGFWWIILKTFFLSVVYSVRYLLHTQLSSGSPVNPCLPKAPPQCSNIPVRGSSSYSVAQVKNLAMIPSPLFPSSPTSNPSASCLDSTFNTNLDYELLTAPVMPPCSHLDCSLLISCSPPPPIVPSLKIRVVFWNDKSDHQHCLQPQSTATGLHLPMWPWGRHFPAHSLCLVALPGLGPELDSAQPHIFPVTVPFASHQTLLAPFHVWVSTQVSSPQSGSPHHIIKNNTSITPYPFILCCSLHRTYYQSWTFFYMFAAVSPTGLRLRSAEPVLSHLLLLLWPLEQVPMVGVL